MDASAKLENSNRASPSCSSRATVQRALGLLRQDEQLVELEALLAFFASFVLESEVVRQIMRWDMAVLRESPWYQEILREGERQGELRGEQQGEQRGRPIADSQTIESPTGGTDAGVDATGAGVRFATA